MNIPEAATGFFQLLHALDCTSPAALLDHLDAWEKRGEDLANISKILVTNAASKQVFARMSFSQKLQASQAIKDIFQNQDWNAFL